MIDLSGKNRNWNKQVKVKEKDYAILSFYNVKNQYVRDYYLKAGDGIDVYGKIEKICSFTLKEIG